MHGTLHSTTTSSSSPCPSRPSSRVASSSVCGGSSGYESTRSHLGPHYSPHNMPRSNSPELKYNTLKPRRRKQNKHMQRQFYSLRLCRKHDNNTRRNYQLYAIPIIKTCPHNKSSSMSTIEPTTPTRTPQDTPESTLKRTSSSTSHLLLTSNEANTATNTKTPPIPMPRMRKTDLAQHIYQNVPPPIFPMDSKVC